MQSIIEHDWQALPAQAQQEVYDFFSLNNVMNKPLPLPEQISIENYVGSGTFK